MERQYSHLYQNLCSIGAAAVCFLLLLSALRFIPADAQTTLIADPASERELDGRIQNFFFALTRRTSSALAELVRRSVFSASGMDSPSVEQLRTEIDKAKTEFGEIINFERYEVKQVGEDVFVIRYILKYEQHPVMWKFTFYRKPSSPSSLIVPSPSTPPSPWTLIKLHFDTDMDSP
jgi:hypothetical protein